MFEKLSPEEVASLDPFGVRRIPASEELAKLLGEEVVSPEWRKEIINREKRALERFFGKEIKVSPLPPEITPEKLLHWKELGMALHYLPSIEMAQEKNFPGWNIKPNDLYEKIQAGEVSREVLKLSGKWVLIDTRDKPDYRGGDQLYSDDFLAPILKKLRENGELYHDRNCPIQTRLRVSWQDYHDILRPKIAKILKVRPDQVRLPRAIEFNFLGNAHYSQWGETDFREWFEDKTIANRCLCGGRSDKGRLADVYVDSVDKHYTNVGFRPLVEF